MKHTIIKNKIIITALALIGVLSLGCLVETRAAPAKKAKTPLMHELRGASVAELNRRLEKVTIRNYPPRTARLTAEQISAVLSPRLRELRAIGNNLPANHVLVVYGHSSRGELATEIERRRLSKMRARLVHDYLKRAGISRMNMIYMGLGDLQPAETPARSRRVGFRVERSRKAALVMKADAR